MVLSCKLPNPKFEIQIKVKVGSEPPVSPWARLEASGDL